MSAEQSSTLTPEELAIARKVVEFGADPAKHGDLEELLQKQSPKTIDKLTALNMAGKRDFDGDYTFCHSTLRPDPYTDRAAKLAGGGQNTSYFIDQALQALEGETGPEPTDE